MKAKAQDILREIVKNHPKSKQADEAKKLLSKLRSQD